MKAGIIGNSGSGRETIFKALTGQDNGTPGQDRIGEALVKDDRLDYLSKIFNPKKHTPARIDLHLPKPLLPPAEALKASMEKVRDADVLLLVVRNFASPGLPEPNPDKETTAVESELLLSDYLIVEKRLERLAEEKKRGKKNDPEELELLTTARELLENDHPLRENPQINASPKLKGFGFLTAKPLVVLLNISDEAKGEDTENKIFLRGRLEEEFSQLSPEEASEFMAEYHLSELAGTRVIKKIYDLMDLISFFTVGEDECRAWTINRGETALMAAGKIHSDIQKGFIRAEVVAYEDFHSGGSFAEAKKKGQFRLEGKTYVVADGDIVHFRFNV